MASDVSILQNFRMILRVGIPRHHLDFFVFAMDVEQSGNTFNDYNGPINFVLLQLVVVRARLLTLLLLQLFLLLVLSLLLRLLFLLSFTISRRLNSPPSVFLSICLSGL